MINWPDDLVSDIARRKCVLFLGAGVSKNSTNASGDRPKDWEEFLSCSLIKMPANRTIKKLINEKDYLTACELIKRNLGRDEFNSLVKSEFQTPKFQSASIHEYVYNLDSKIVATPNFDKIYDIYAEHAADGNIIIKNYYDNDVADCIRRHEPVILKVHGTISSPDKLIFSRKDYCQARLEHKNFYTILDALAITNTFIFIGCGVNDPDIRLLLEDYSFRFSFAKKHYIIMPKNSLDKQVLSVVEETMNLKAIMYDPKDYHSELTTSLEELVKLVEIKRQELADTLKW
jgi:hypothetical protein